MTDRCPCESGAPANSCCRPVILNRSAETAEALMRSRYTAYVLRDTDYLLNTWDRGTRPADLALDPAQRWLGLRIRRTEAGGPADDHGIVEFVARYKIGGQGYRLHETSEFRKVNGRWFYTRGVVNTS